MDFLHVWISTLILGVRSVAGLPKVAVFFIGKGLSLACGIAIVLVAWDIMRRLGTARAGTAAGLATLALAGPLAVWSCSSLEAVPFALVVTLLTGALILAPTELPRPPPSSSCFCGSTVSFTRGS